MLRSSLRFALRSLWRRPGTSLVHAGGLAVGIACCFLALLYVQDEKSYDRFHEDAEQIVTIKQQFMYGDMPVQIQTAAPEAIEALRTGASGVVAVTTTDLTPGFVRRDGQPEGLAVENIRFADAEFFDVFTFPLASGDAQTALVAPNQAVLTESLARTLFGHADVIGEAVFVERTGFSVPDPEPLALTVSAVAETPPEASSVPFEMLISGSTPLASFNGPTPALGGAKPAYVRLASTADTVSARAAIEAALPDDDGDSAFSMPLLVNQHFEGASDSLTGEPTYLFLFSIVAGLILLLACINYANLATALATQRSVEVGVRKALGAGRGQLGAQFLGEALLLTLGAGVLAVALTALVLPTFNAFFGKDVMLSSLPLSLIAAMAGIVALAGFIAGGYPALVLARFQPARALSGVTSVGRGGVFIRRGLVVFQFAITSVLLGATLLVAGQLSSVQTRDLGFSGDRVVVLNLRGQGLTSRRDVLKQAMQALPAVEHASIATGTPGGARSAQALSPPGTEDDPSDDVFVEFIQADADYQTTLGLTMASGEWFAPEAMTDTASGVILNETGARALGLMTTNPQEAIGQTVSGGEVVGVVRDFHYMGPRLEITPLVFYPEGDEMSTTLLAVQIAADRTPEALASIEAAWKKAAPEYPFSPVFVNDQFADQLREDRQLGQLFALFGGVAVLLACFGMLGLAAHAAQRRTKEFGIRKVLGATAAGLVARLSREFLALVFLALVLATPVLVIGARRWLEGFAYPGAVQPGPFVALGLGVLLLALATVSVHALRVATADPIRSLRSE